MDDMTNKTVPVEPTRETYLLNGMRFKMSFFEDEDGASYVTCFNNFEKELDGRWVALVAAEDDRHLEAAQPSPVTELEVMLANAATQAESDLAWVEKQAKGSNFQSSLILLRQALAAYEAKKGAV